MSKFELGVVSGKEIGVVFSDKKIIMLPAVNVKQYIYSNAVLETVIVNFQLSYNSQMEDVNFCRKRIV